MMLSVMTEIALALDRPALTPEVRAWITSHPARRRPVLIRGGQAGLPRGTVLLRIDIDAASEAEAQDELESLLTDLRMLGLRPKLLDRDLA
jgi:hypothetical protein